MTNNTLPTPTMKTTIISPREVLEVSNLATFAEIDAQKKKLALQHHPDKNPHNVEAATAKMQQINEAAELLLDHKHTRKYKLRKVMDLSYEYEREQKTYDHEFDATDARGQSFFTSDLPYPVPDSPTSDSYTPFLPPFPVNPALDQAVAQQTTKSLLSLLRKAQDLALNVRTIERTISKPPMWVRNNLPTRPVSDAARTQADNILSLTAALTPQLDAAITIITQAKDQSQLDELTIFKPIQVAQLEQLAPLLTEVKLKLGKAMKPRSKPYAFDKKFAPGMMIEPAFGVWVGEAGKLVKVLDVLSANLDIVLVDETKGKEVAKIDPIVAQQTTKSLGSLPLILDTEPEMSVNIDPCYIGVGGGDW